MQMSWSINLIIKQHMLWVGMSSLSEKCFEMSILAQQIYYLAYF